MQIISVKETIEAAAWALDLSYEAYVLGHQLEFETPPMDQQTFYEFCDLMARWLQRSGE